MNAVDTKAVKSDKLNVKITEREDEMTGLSTLCYIEKDNKYLMLHRIKKKNDVNEGKWIGVGGHVEYQESPEECLVREVKEETGLTLTSYRFRGVVYAYFLQVLWTCNICIGRRSDRIYVFVSRRWF